MAGAFTLVSGTVYRGLTKTHDINWSKTKDPMDDQHIGYYKNKQSNIFNPRDVDYKKLWEERKHIMNNMGNH